MTTSTDSTLIDAQTSMASIRQKLKLKSMAARLRLDLLNQDTWWVPAAGWAKLVRDSTVGVKVADVHAGSGVPVKGSERIGMWLTLNMETLSSEAGEKIAIADLDVSHRRHIVTFLWKHVPSILSGLYWETSVMDDPFGVADDGAMAAMEREATLWLDLSHDEDVKRSWFDGLALIKALRQATIDEIDNRVPRPVLLG